MQINSVVVVKILRLAVYWNWKIKNCNWKNINSVKTETKTEVLFVS